MKIYVLLFHLNNFLSFTVTYLLSLFKHLFSHNNLILFLLLFIVYTHFFTLCNSFKTLNLSVCGWMWNWEGQTCFLEVQGFFKVPSLPHGVRKRPNGWDSSLPHFDLNQRISAFCICLCNTGVLGKMSLGKKEFLCRKGWREGKGNSEGRRKERERKQTSLLESTGVCVCTYAYVPSVIMKGVFVCV